MATTKSFQDYSNVPSAIIWDGTVPIPLWAVTTMSLSETYHLPPIGSTGARSVVATHDDTVSLNGVLVGTERFTWKLILETMAEASKRGSALAAIPFIGGSISGLVLVTSLTIRTDMQIQTLAFSVSAARRDTIDVAISMVHMPLPGGLGKLLDVASLGVAALADWAGN